MPTKPGINTSEFWTTLIAALAPWLAIFMTLAMVWSGAVTMSDAMPVLAALGLGGGLGASYSVGQYAKSRAAVKQQVSDQ